MGLLYPNSAHAHHVHGAPSSTGGPGNALCPSALTVTVTVTVTTSAFATAAGISYKQGYSHGSPPVVSSCFDRAYRPFTYTYSHGYHYNNEIDTSSNSGGIYNSYQSFNPGMFNHTVSTSYTASTHKASALSNSVSPPYATPVTNSTLTKPSGVTSVSSKPSCDPSLELVGASETSFNKKGSAFSLKMICSKLDTQNYTAFANFLPVENMNATADGITIFGLNDDYVLLSIFAIDSFGTAFFKTYQLLFGNINMPISVLGPDGQPASNVLVYGNATSYPGVSQTCTTDASGVCTLENLTATTIGLVAKTGDNSIAVNGLAASPSQVTLKLMPYDQPEDGASFDVNNGTSGWTGGAVSQSLKVKRDTTLVVSTNGQFDLQTANNSFPVHPFTKTAYIKYKFVTAEVPGGYFGSQFNDYYSVTIRSDTGAFVTVTNSMNALGLGAFDASGATDWFTLTLGVPANTKSVEYNIGVSNVADNLLDSSVIVDKVGDLQCEQCGDCTSCPSDPMCQPSCTNPPPKSCSFYRNCAEGQLGCGATGYPLGYGEKNCNKFEKNLGFFSPQGQAWIFGTMHCLQVAMVPMLQPCTATCDSFRSAAFASHAGCYVSNGVCGLGCADIMWLFMTVGGDLVTKESLSQVLETAEGCLNNLIQTLSGCTGELLAAAIVGTSALASKAMSTAIKVVLKYLSS
ncbi:hypothetical protein GP486_001217 [Trichoglossum hirsutum]|uniref:Uncharacterized protein n=1 Tax=Trichoglossum hirsutum TaxID=265104 RepID=A0A9P8RTB0_9PEZI|nr:hypothetical protein GP486_001217 [Trichoglossum hirsutum]